MASAEDGTPVGQQERNYAFQTHLSTPVNGESASSPSASSLETSSTEKCCHYWCKSGNTVHRNNSSSNSTSSSAEAATASTNFFTVSSAAASSQPPITVSRINHPLEESVLWSFIVAILSLCFALALAFPVLVAVIALVPVMWLGRYVIEGICVVGTSRCCKRGHGGACHLELVCPNDAQWIERERSGDGKRMTSVMHAVLVFDNTMDMAQLRQILLKRVIHAKSPSGGKAYPRFSQRVISGKAAYRWEPYVAFNVAEHVVMGPSLRDDVQLQVYVAGLLTEPLPLSRPLWEVRVLHECGPNRDTVAIVRVHQCVADGMSLVRVLCHALSDQQLRLAWSSQVMHVPQRPHFAGLSFSLNVIRALLIGPFTLACWWGQTALATTSLRRNSRRSCCASSSSKKVGVEEEGGGRARTVSVVWSATLPMAKVLRIKQITRSTINDVLLTAVAGSVHEWLKRKGVLPPRDLSMVLPVDLRNDISSPKSHNKLGWKVGALLGTVPSGVEGAVPRLWAVRRHLEEVRASADPAIVYGAAAILLRILPHRLARALIHAPANVAALQFSSLPGPNSTMLVGGHALKAIYPLLPPTGSQTLSVSLFTYAEQVHITVLARGKRAATFLLDTFMKQVDQLSDLLAHRRVPGEMRRVLSSRRDDYSRPSIQEIHLKLYYVQEELHKLSQRVEIKSREEIDDDDDEYEGARLTEMRQRLQMLKDEFSALLAELRRRSSVGGEDSSSFEDEEEEEFRRPRKRALSATSLRRFSVATTSSSRPLAAAQSRKASLAASFAMSSPPTGRTPRRKSCPSTSIHRIASPHTSNVTTTVI